MKKFLNKKLEENAVKQKSDYNYIKGQLEKLKFKALIEKYKRYRNNRNNDME